MSDNQRFYFTSLGKDNTAYLFWMMGSITWVLGFLYVNENSIDNVSSNLSRGLALIIFNLAMLYFPQKPTYYQRPKTPSQSLNFVSIRHSIIAVYGYAFAEAQFYLPAPVIYTIYFSGPLFIVLIDYFIFDIKITIKQTKGAIIAFIGVILASNGQMILAWFSDSQQQFQTNFEYKTDSYIAKSLIGLGLIVLTVGWSCAAIFARKCIQITTSQCNLNLGYIITFLACIVFMYDSPETKDLYNNLPLLLKCLVFQGIPLFVCQHFFMHALLLTKKSGVMTMVGFIGVVFSYFLSIFLYGEELNWLCFLGTALVIYGVFKVVIK